MEQTHNDNVQNERYLRQERFIGSCRRSFYVGEKDIRAAREALEMYRRTLAEMVNVSNRYLANIELGEIIPSIPVAIQLMRICRLPAERYFNSGLVQDSSEQRQRINHKLQLCAEKYLPIVEATINGAINMEE